MKKKQLCETRENAGKSFFCVKLATYEGNLRKNNKHIFIFAPFLHWILRVNKLKGSTTYVKR